MDPTIAGPAATRRLGPPRLRTLNPGEARRLSRDDLPAIPYDPLAELAQGMPGMPTGFDGDPDGDGHTKQAAGNGQPGCSVFEEEFGGLCYKTCADLTNGTFPNRFAPDGCCKTTGVSCMLPSNVRVRGYMPGSGFMINGEGHAPHPVGLCDGNEEMHANTCFKKCALLTDDEYPIRSAANTCCKKMPCLWNIKTEGTGVCTGFGVGGGLVPAHGCPHAPRVEQTTST